MLSELLPPERVRVPLGSHAKAELLRELVRLALPDADEATCDGVIAVIEAREADTSTAMGGGLAVPHGRTDLVHEMRVSAGLVSGIRDYEAADGSPIRVAFLVLTPVTATGQHVRLLARIARLMHDPASRRALLASRTAMDFVGVIRQADGERTVLVS